MQEQREEKAGFPASPMDALRESGRQPKDGRVYSTVVKKTELELRS